MEFDNTIDDKSYLVVKSSELSEIIQYINNNNVKSILINDFRGFNEKSVDFFKYCDQVENIFLVEGDYDISGIKHLKKLKNAIIGPIPKQPINLSQFENIESLSIDYHKNWIDLFKCTTLKDLRIWKLPFETLKEISVLSNLNFLKLVQGKTKSLKGIDELNLAHFEAHKISSLKDIGISREYKTLENFHIYDCKSVQNHERIKNAKNLKSLRYANCGEMESISFIKDMSKLKEFRFPKTLVKDGDLSYLKNVDVIMYNDKKHYSHKYKDLFLDRIKRGLMS